MEDRAVHPRACWPVSRLVGMGDAPSQSAVPQWLLASLCCANTLRGTTLTVAGAVQVGAANARPDSRLTPA